MIAKIAGIVLEHFGDCFGLSSWRPLQVELPGVPE
jgi:hypothetical protein